MSLLALLAARLGRETARLELAWMRQVEKRPRQLETMVRRRADGQPLQYILGTQPFGPLDLLTRPPVLIPRPETEAWSIWLSERVSPTPQHPISVLDLCTGSGCIPLLLCHLWPKGSVRAYGVDISSDAIALAKDNAVRCRISTDMQHAPRSNVFTPVLADIRNSSFVDDLRPPFDIITSNPPYISRKEYELLPSCVKDYEDPRALLGDSEHSAKQDGLSFYHLIARLVSNKGILKKDGLMVLEVGDGQADGVQEIMRYEGGLRNTDIWRDHWNKNRTVVAWSKRSPPQSLL